VSYNYVTDAYIGKDYFHQQLNPANQCQWCDLFDQSTKLSEEWKTRPSLPCDDGDPCTKNDMCSQGKCVGKRYSCQSVQKDCVKATVCLGDGKCRDIMKHTRTICRAANDSCDEPERYYNIMYDYNYYSNITVSDIQFYLANPN
jgi:hypothetical protein